LIFNPEQYDNRLVHIKSSAAAGTFFLNLLGFILKILIHFGINLTESLREGADESEDEGEDEDEGEHEEKHESEGLHEYVRLVKERSQNQNRNRTCIFRYPVGC
jgi:hypothetical protein